MKILANPKQELVVSSLVILNAFISFSILVLTGIASTDKEMEMSATATVVNLIITYVALRLLLSRKPIWFR